MLMNDTQKELLKLLIEFDDICKEQNIEYILAGGCALGAVRNNGFLPWDDDVDILIKRSEFEKLDKYMSSYVKPDRAWLTEDNTPEYNNPVARYYDLNTTLIYRSMLCIDIPHGHHLEIFIMDPYPDNPEDQLRFNQMLWLYTELRQPYFISANYGMPVEVTDKELYYSYKDLMEKEGVAEVIKKIKDEITQYSEKKCHLWCGRWGHAQYVFEDSWVGQTQMVQFEGYEFPAGKGVFHHMRENYDSNWDMIPKKSNRAVHFSIDNTNTSFNLHKNEYTEIITNTNYKEHFAKQKVLNLERFFCTLEWQRSIAKLRYALLSKEVEILEEKEWAFSVQKKKIISSELNTFLRYQFMPSYIKFKMAVPLRDDLYETIMYFLIDENRYEDACMFNDLYTNKKLHNYFKEVLYDLGELKMTRYYHNCTAANHLLERFNKSELLKTQIEVERAKAWILLYQSKRMRKKKISNLFQLFRHNDDPEITKYIGDIFYKNKCYMQADECYEFFNKNSRNGMLKNEIRIQETEGKK